MGSVVFAFVIQNYKGMSVLIGASLAWAATKVIFHDVKGPGWFAQSVWSLIILLFGNRIVLLVFSHL